MSLEFTTAKRRREPITFTLDDEEYEFIPGKQASIALAAIEPGSKEDQQLGVFRETFDWLGNGLNDDQRQHLIDRLTDPEDDLDIDQLGDIISKLQDQVAGRPTMSPAGSSASPTRNGRSSTGGRQRKASTSSS